MLTESTSPEYHLPGVLHYLQVEWRRFERERNEWTIERAELKARIALLEGERRGIDNLKNDLLKRVKMLEYALHQERKRHLATKMPANVLDDKVEIDDADVSAAIQQQARHASSPSQPVADSHDLATADTRIREKSRQSLKTCLQEINYLTSMPSKLPMTYTLAHASRSSVSASPQQASPPTPSSAPGTPNAKFSRSQRAPNRFGNAHGSRSGTGAVIASSQGASLASSSSSPSSPPMQSTSSLVAHQPQPHPLLQATSPTASGFADTTAKSSPPLPDQPTTSSAANPSPPVVENVDEIEMLDNVIDTATNRPAADGTSDLVDEDPETMSKTMQAKYNLSDDRMQKMMKQANKALKSNKRDTSPESLSFDKNDLTDMGTKADSSTNKVWKTKMTFKGHLDSVRTVAFHPREMLFATGSDDGTIKIVNMQRSVGRDGHPLKKSHEDLDAMATYRGHTQLVTKLAIDGDQGRMYSSSLDSTIRVWRLPPDTHTAFSPVDPSLYITTFIGHTDAIWDFCLSPSSPLLASAAADGKVKVWNTAGTGDLLKQSWHVGDHHATPTSLDFCRTDSRKLMVAKTDASIQLYDVETGQIITTWHTSDLPDGQASGRINTMVAHPTMNVVLAGYEDRYIRCFDINSGKATFEMSSHLDAVSALDIEPSGLSFVSGGHDSSLRFWDMTKTKSCTQEISAHRKKGDEGVLAVQFHPRFPWLISSGADAIVKVYHPGH
ncbi:WD40-repeat-containing domain protein [Gongronella butleri]|nr:WD40-repeat-containing domain protein [Gongronella butleri]